MRRDGKSSLFKPTPPLTPTSAPTGGGSGIAGFDVPTLFRIDSEAALSRREHGQPASPDFNELLEFLNRELAERGRSAN